MHSIAHAWAALLVACNSASISAFSRCTACASNPPSVQPFVVLQGASAAAANMPFWLGIIEVRRRITQLGDDGESVPQSTGHGRIASRVSPSVSSRCIRKSGEARSILSKPWVTQRLFFPTRVQYQQSISRDFWCALNHLFDVELPTIPKKKHKTPSTLSKDTTVCEFVGMFSGQQRQYLLRHHCYQPYRRYSPSSPRLHS
ncbi:hypothetical protein V8B97DRAFT_484992 [Scleroderma yunnanense]